MKKVEPLLFLMWVGPRPLPDPSSLTIYHNSGINATDQVAQIPGFLVTPRCLLSVLCEK